MIDRLLGLPRDKEKGIAIFEMNDPVMPTRQTHSSIRSFRSSGSFAFEDLCRKDSSARYQSASPRRRITIGLLFNMRLKMERQGLNVPIDREGISKLEL
jgi:hypothetical protein